MSASPRISTVGLSGFAVTFAGDMSHAANCAAIAFRAAVEAAQWPEVRETSSTLVSCFIAADLAQIDLDSLRARLDTLLTSRDWLEAALPPGRKLWTIPCCFDADAAPQMAQAAEAAGLTEADARAELMAARTRVITLGYAPGQPYLGTLAPHWNIPRQSELTPRVPAGALVVAIRQLVIFTSAMPTGWRHIGTMAFRMFDPNRDIPVALTPGDEIRFAAIAEAELDDLHADSMGGAAWEALP
jgi:inhibitor of KinA